MSILTLFRSGIITPHEIGNVVSWGDANDPAGNGTHPSPSSALATVVDKSGRANNFVQLTGASQALFIPNVQNGLPAIRFDGVNDSMSCNALSSIMTGTDRVITVFAACIPRNSATTRTLWSTSNNGAPNTSGATFQHRINTGGTWGLVKRDNAATLKNNIAGAYTLATPYISVVRVNAGGTTGDVTINAVKIMNGVDIDLGACTITNFYLGTLAGSNGGTQFWNGDMLEFFMLDVSASDSQVAAGKKYFSQKWRIAV